MLRRSVETTVISGQTIASQNPALSAIVGKRTLTVGSAAWFPMDFGGIGSGPAGVNAQVATDGPTQKRQRLQERLDASLKVRIARNGRQEHADAPHVLRLLRAHRQRPHCRRPTEQRDEVAPPHSITSSARPISVLGMLTPSVFAVFRFRDNSTFVACWTGRSLGFSPFKMRAT